MKLDWDHVARVPMSGDPGTWSWGVPDVQGARVVLRPSREVVAECTLGSGLFWSLDEGNLLIGPRLQQVIEARTQATTFARSWLTALLLGTSHPQQTPYAEVRRIPPAMIAKWLPGRCEPSLTEALRLPEPVRAGECVVAEYVSVFDRAVDDLLPPNEPMCATMSGGLDSTFVVASLLRHAGPDRPVHAFVHRPHPQAALVASGNWDPDDSDVARSMCDLYPGRLVINELINDPLEMALDVSLRISDDAWMPAANPDNMVWIQRALSATRDLGASVLFMGENGNSAFSYSHSYAAGYYLRNLNVSAVLDMLAAERDRGAGLRRALRRQVAAPLLGPVKAAVTSPKSSPSWFVDAPRTRSGWSTRQAYLAWMLARDSRRAFAQPASDGLRMADPFTAAGVLHMAASVAPTEWTRGPADRGFARRAGFGRVPDAIRLRTRRGGQSWDAWYAIRDQRDRYVEEVRLLRSTPVMEDMLDIDGLEAEVMSWPWGQVQSPSFRSVVHVNRLLHLAAFTRMTVNRLARLPGRPPTVKV